MIRLQNGDVETARLIERHLFDQGYLVHVVEGDDAAQMVASSFQVGLVSIVFGTAWQPPAGIPADQVITIDRKRFQDDAAMLQGLVAMLAGGSGSVPLTDGAGI